MGPCLFFLAFGLNDIPSLYSFPASPAYIRLLGCFFCGHPTISDLQPDANGASSQPTLTPSAWARRCATPGPSSTETILLGKGLAAPNHTAVSKRRTDVRPMLSFLAIADLLSPRLVSLLISCAFLPTVTGRPCGRPSLRAW